jgi:hypothetical protein
MRNKPRSIARSCDPGGMTKSVATLAAVVLIASCKSSDQSSQGSAATPPAAPPATPHLTTSKTIDQGIAEIREAARAKHLTVDLTDVKALAGRRFVLRAKGKVTECNAFRPLLGDVKAPPDCLVALCRAEGEVLWNQIAWGGAWTDVGTTENCD